MTNRFFKDEEVRRLREGPLGCYIDAYAALLVEQGYSRWSARSQLRLIADFSRWLHRQGLHANDLNREIIGQYLKRRKRCTPIRRGDVASLRRLLNLLCDLGIIEREPTPTRDGPCEHLADEFGHYLFKERTLAAKTVADHLRVVRRFLLERFGKDSIRLSELCAKDITDFVQRHAYEFSHGRYRVILTVLRTFLRYLLWQGEISTDLAACVPSVANRKFATLPKSLEAGQVELVLSKANRRTAIGKRNYAILLLLARLGLRAGEVVKLTLDDIDWGAGEITIHGKGERMARLPLPHDAGAAIADYLQHGRPSCTSRRVFVRQKAPLVGFANSIAISALVCRALERAGVDSPRKGAHLFRHTLATEMLRRGASLPEIGELLRHRDPDTTEIYAKVDLVSLRTLAMPWPKGGAK